MSDAIELARLWRKCHAEGGFLTASERAMELAERILKDEEPELPEVEVFDAMTPDGRKCRCTKIAGFELNRAVMIGASGPFITEFRDNELTDKRPVEPKPPAPSDLMERAARAVVWAADVTVSSRRNKELRNLASELRKHTAPVAVTADELERWSRTGHLATTVNEMRAKAAELRRDEG